jgi:uncharacterized RDD family membrane protein YckC
MSNPPHPDQPHSHPTGEGGWQQPTPQAPQFPAGQQPGPSGPQYPAGQQPGPPGPQYPAGQQPGPQATPYPTGQQPGTPSPPYAGGQYPGMQPGALPPPGYQPQQSQTPPGMPHPGWQHQRPNYAHWGRRVGGFLIDNIPYYVALIPYLIWYAQFMSAVLSAAATGTAPPPDLYSGSIGWLLTAFVLQLAALGFMIYNRWILAGRTGQSIGRRVLKIRLIGEQTGRPIGGANAFLRDLCHVLDGIAYIGYLWPLWDERRRTFADMIMTTIVVDAPETPSGNPFKPYSSPHHH